ncbi:MAG TPA: hypothetical protein PK265_02245 [Candidatus Saccharibacteria bacterium]|nr:hypothetical protein [Candidatus Saccharibacteria bacterium]HRQ98123.1 hypothetical protein [Candidatus Saccharibacteria bacterium]
MIQNITKFTIKVLSSHKFIFVIIGLLVIQALWFAFTAQYPMAFDEQYHFGFIQIYANQWLPFITSEPANTSAYGVLIHSNSYLFHYLMSFPYRIFAFFVSDQVSQIIFLRVINVAMFAGGIALFGRLLNRFNVSRSLINFALLMMVLIPVVPFLAATINYDNLIFLFVPIFVGAALTCAKSILDSNKIPSSSFIILLSIGFAGSLTKNAFLPIFAGGIIYLLILWLRSHTKRKIISSIGKSFSVLKRPVQIALVILLIMTAGLFIERYGGNLVTYHSLEPDCLDVKSFDSCMESGPWARNYQLENNVQVTNPPHNPSITAYPYFWVSELVRRLYFAINYDYSNIAPLPIAISMARIVGAVGIVLALVFWRSIIRIDKRLLLLTFVIGFYLAGLFYINFTAFLKFHVGVAINGRYLIPILPFMFVWMALGYRQLFQLLLRKRARNFMAIFSIVVLLLALQGGGAITYLVQSQPSWYWQNQPLVDFNTGLKDIVKPVIIGGSDPWSK